MAARQAAASAPLVPLERGDPFAPLSFFGPPYLGTKKSGGLLLAPRGFLLRCVSGRRYSRTPALPSAVTLKGTTMPATAWPGT